MEIDRERDRDREREREREREGEREKEKGGRADVGLYCAVTFPSIKKSPVFQQLISFLPTWRCV